MAYDQTEPKDEDLGISRVNLINNFTAIESYISKDHVSFDDNGANAGLHQQVTFDDQHTPAGAASANQGILYVEGAVAALKFMNSSGTAQSITGLDVTAAANGSITLHGGIIIKWGSGSGSTAGSTNTFPSAFPNNCWNVQFITRATKKVVGVTIVDKTKFTAFSDGATSIYYIAIGN